MRQLINFRLIPAGVKELSPPPAYIDERIKLYDTLRAQYLEELAAKPKNKINVTLPDGKVVEGLSWESTPYEIARGISQGLADNTVIGKVNGELWDLDRPLEGDCSLKLLKFDDPEAQAVFWHSSAHILGEAMERCFGGKLCYGPPIESGFYYDMFHEGDGVSNKMFGWSQDLSFEDFLLILKIFYENLSQVETILSLNSFLSPSPLNFRSRRTITSRWKIW